MVKLPINPDPISPDYVEKRTQFLHDFGAFLALWSEFELTLEVKIARLVGMEALDGSIVLGGLNFGSKPAILYALLDQRGQTDAIEKVRKVINHAKRNALVHGVAGGDADEQSFVFFKREIATAHVVKHISFTAETFNDHFEIFRRLYAEASDALGIKPNDLETYGRKTGLFEPTPPRQPSQRQRGASDGG